MIHPESHPYHRWYPHSDGPKLCCGHSEIPKEDKQSVLNERLLIISVHAGLPLPGPLKSAKRTLMTHDENILLFVRISSFTLCHDFIQFLISWKKILLQPIPNHPLLRQCARWSVLHYPQRSPGSKLEKNKCTSPRWCGIQSSPM